MTTYESVLAILILPINPKVITIISIALGGILLINYFFLLP
jgi:preprotein translocase subunit Sec61beta